MRKLTLLALSLFLVVALGACTSSGGSVDAFCDEARTLEGEDPEPEEFGAAFDRLIDEAPDEIKGDIETIRDAFAPLAEADSDDPAAFTAALEAAESPEVMEASENLDAFLKDECGIDTEGDTDTTGG